MFRRQRECSVHVFSREDLDGYWVQRERVRGLGSGAGKGISRRLCVTIDSSLVQIIVGREGDRDDLSLFQEARLRDSQHVCVKSAPFPYATAHCRPQETIVKGHCACKSHVMAAYIHFFLVSF